SVVFDIDLRDRHWIHLQENCMLPLDYAGFSTTCESIESFTSSPTTTPPVSSNWFQPKPKSLRLSLPVALNPARLFPYGSLATPSSVASSAISFVTPCSVNSPMSRYWFESRDTCSTRRLLKVIVGYLSTSKKSGDLRC